MRTFIYCRVSTREQDTQNQVLAIERAGYKVPESRVISEDISGSVQAMQRPKFRAMVEHKLEAGDQLVVLKLDRLGRDNIDVQQTIGHCCKVSDEAAFCLIQRPYISKTLLTRRISPRGSP